MRWNSLKNQSIFILGSVILTFLALLIIVIFTIADGFDLMNWPIDPAKADAYGSFIGGLGGSLFSLVGIFLIYEALMKQQELDETQRIENQIFELTSRLRDNVSAMSYHSSIIDMGTVEGEKCFIVFDKEYQYIRDTITELASAHNIDIDIKHISCFIHIYGSGNEIGDRLQEVIKSSSSNIDNLDFNSFFDSLREKIASVDDGFFSCHDKRLNQYIRHLGAIIKLAKHKSIKSPAETKRFINMVRSQLTLGELSYLQKMIEVLPDEFEHGEGSLKQRWQSRMDEYKFLRPLEEAINVN